MDQLPFLEEHYIVSTYCFKTTVIIFRPLHTVYNPQDNFLIIYDIIPLGRSCLAFLKQYHVVWYRRPLAKYKRFFFVYEWRLK